MIEHFVLCFKSSKMFTCIHFQLLFLRDVLYIYNVLFEAYHSFILNYLSIQWCITFSKISIIISLYFNKYTFWYKTYYLHHCIYYLMIYQRIGSICVISIIGLFLSGILWKSQHFYKLTEHFSLCTLLNHVNLLQCFSNSRPCSYSYETVNYLY